MSSESQGLTREPFTQLMRGAMVTLAGLVVARFVLELAGMPQDFARYVSSTVGLLLVAIYVAAVGPLRGGLRKFSQLLLPCLDPGGMDGRMDYFGNGHRRSPAHLAEPFRRAGRLWQLGSSGHTCAGPHRRNRRSFCDQSCY